MKSMDDLLPQDPTTVPRDELDRMLQRESQQKELKLIKYVEIEQLWQLMSSMYGHKWTSAYGDIPDPDKVWYAILKDVTWEQMQFGMNKLADSGASWPPAAPEFKKLALNIEEGVSTVRTPDVESTRKNFLGIEDKSNLPEADERVAKIHAIRDLLK